MQRRGVTALAPGEMTKWFPGPDCPHRGGDVGQRIVRLREIPACQVGRAKRQVGHGRIGLTAVLGAAGPQRGAVSISDRGTNVMEAHRGQRTLRPAAFRVALRRKPHLQCHRIRLASDSPVGMSSTVRQRGHRVCPPALCGGSVTTEPQEQMHKRAAIAANEAVSNSG